MCVGCRRVDEQHHLIRLARLANHRVVLDRQGKRGGRGAYLCHNPGCWKTAMKRHSVERALRIQELHPLDRDALVQFTQSLEEATMN